MRHCPKCNHETDACGVHNCLHCGTKLEHGHNNLPDVEHVITDADKAVCLGSGEIKPCPFCGASAISAGEKKQSGNTVYTVICTGLHECGATVHVCQKDAEQARREAIEQWNRRLASPELKALREMVSRFLVAHRDVHRNWMDAFVECGAITIDYDYHPLYPFIKPKEDNGL